MPPVYSLQLTPEQIEIRDTVRDFAAAEIKPVAFKPERMEAVDTRPLPEVLRQAAQMGLRTLMLSEEMGGAGADGHTAAIVAEELAAGDPGTAAILSTTSLLAHALFDRLVSPAQRERHLAAFIEDDAAQLAWAQARTDTEIGINYHRPHEAQRMTVTARRAGDGYVLDGTARFVANAPLATLLAVSATTDPDAPGIAGVITALVPRGTAGISITAHAGGRFHGSCGDVSLKDCRVPADDLLGKDAAGRSADRALRAAHELPLEAAINLGIGRAMYEEAVDYAKLRVQGTRPIIEHQAIAVKLAEAAVRIEVARNAIWAAAWALDHPEAVADRSLPDLPLSTIARAFTAEAIYRSVKDCAECFGAMSVMRDIPAHRHVKDARISLHAGAGAADAKYAIAEAVAGFRRG